MSRLGRWYRTRLRNKDIKFLLPTILRQFKKQYINDTNLAITLTRAVFTMHAWRDYAWTTEFTKYEIEKLIDEIELT